MPEGHKTHFLARVHQTKLGGDAVDASSPQGRFRAGAKQLDGRRLESVQAVGKQLFYRFEDDLHLQIHLGRYGGFKEHPTPAPQPVGQIRLRLSGTTTTLDLSGPTTCRLVSAEERADIAAQIGPDPLAGGRWQDVWPLFQATRRPLGAVLLDQRIVAGIGNIFRAELLFELGLNPLLPANALSEADFRFLWRALVRMMRTGLKYGRIITVTRKEVTGPLTQLNGNDRFRIYGHETCPACDGPVVKTPVGGRPLYQCQRCQSHDAIAPPLELT